MRKRGNRLMIFKSGRLQVVNDNGKRICHRTPTNIYIIYMYIYKTLYKLTFPTKLLSVYRNRYNIITIYLYNKYEISIYMYMCTIYIYHNRNSFALILAISCLNDKENLFFGIFVF